MHWYCGGGLVSIVLRDVGPSLVGGWVLPHERTILQKHNRNAGEQVTYCQIRSLAKIRKCLTTAACKTIVYALSRVDYGNALLFGLPEMLLHKLQMIQNSPARLVTGTNGRDHITPVLSKLHWLPVRYRIELKLLVLVYQAVHHLGPVYLTSLVTPYAPTRSLRSAAHRSLTVSRYNLERYGRRAFSVAGPSLWNKNYRSP